MDKTLDPLLTRPHTVAIVALGPSNHDFVSSAACKKDFLQADEVWVVNSAVGVFCADKAFIMDDLKGIERRFPQWSAKLSRSDTPIITCRQYPDYPSSCAYPLDHVSNDIKDDFLTNTVAYAIAYAIHIKVKDLYIFGADFWYPGSQAVEAGASCCAYLLGIAKERGINYRIPQSSTLLDAHLTKVKDGRVTRPLYGYDYNPGEMKEKVERGIATDQEKALAAKAPKTLDKKASRTPDLTPNAGNGEDKETSNGLYQARP